MKKVVEASCLTADSAAHYRTILRYFYHQHERMRDFIAPEEVLEYMRSIPVFSDYQEDQLHQHLAQLVKWNNLIARQDMTSAWFLGSSNGQGELEILQWKTNEMIRRMTRYVQRIGERQQHFRSRKNDYLHLAKWFSDCSTLDEAHKFSSVVFGAMTIHHGMSTLN